MKWLGRIFVFAACFLAGLSLTLVIGYVALLLASPASPASEAPTDSQPSYSARGIQISYVGWKRSEDDSDSGRIRLAVYNGLLQPVRYYAHDPKNVWPSITINEKEIEKIFGCGTGIQTFYILPGETVEFEVSTFRFTQTPKAGDRTRVGFYLRPLTSDKSEVYYSEPFVLPEEFRQEIANMRQALTP